MKTVVVGIIYDSMVQNIHGTQLLKTVVLYKFTHLCTYTIYSSFPMIDDDSYDDENVFYL